MIIFDLGLGQESFSQNYIGCAHARVAMKIKEYKNSSLEKDFGGIPEHFD